jgi:class 3 adenylate cyclase/tetratricopeptide (TPR) repeat protein
MRCAACGHDNRASAKFCEDCAAPFVTKCASCGAELRPAAKFCDECATPVGGSQRLTLPEPRAYTPKHLVDKILTSRSTLEGERKQVTVLFADLVGYTTLSAQLGEEALFALMDELYKQLIGEIHRYEGTVNELTGDGLVAFFGAPLAVEQAPQRAVRAALALQETVAQRSAKTKQGDSLSLQLRIGINTGPVIVGTIGNDLRMDYKAVGQTVNLAARMEQSAAPGTIQLAENTYKLVAGYFECKDLGLIDLKNVEKPVHAYQVGGEHRVRTRIEVARERGFTRLVARDHELALLAQCMDLVERGRGQVVSIIGEAGLGKSRLLHEFQAALARREYAHIEGRCQPYGVTVAYGPILEVLRQLFHIDAGDEDVREKIQRGLEASSSALAAAAPYVRHLLGIETSGELPEGLSPEAVKHRTFESLRTLLCESARTRPLVLIIEDLHWADPTTVEFLSFLVEQIASVRLLLVCAFRPEFACPWSRKSFHRVVTLTPLAHSDTSGMLATLLRTARVQDELLTLVMEKTEGVPFFIEELVRSLRETGAIERIEDRWQLASGAGAVPVPDSVEEVLSARIDRLPDGAKSVLQIGAVVGREWSEQLVREVAGVEGQELTAHLAALTDGELLYARGLPPETTYMFSHAFTQEAAYHSLLTARRRELHHRVAVTLEALSPDRLEELSGTLARHYCEGAQGEEVRKAVAYAKRAGDRNMALPAFAEAVRLYRMGLQVLERQESRSEEERSALLLALGEAQWRAGEPVAAEEVLLQAAESARTVGATALLARAALVFGRMTQQLGLFGPSSVRLLEEALETLGANDSVLKAETLGALARTLGVTGEQRRALPRAQQAIAMARRLGDQELLAANLEGMILALYRPEHVEECLALATEMLKLAEAVNRSELMRYALCWRVYCTLELGEVSTIDADIDRFARLGEESQEPFALCLNILFRAMQTLMRGRFADSEDLAQRGLAAGQRLQTGNAAGVFGIQMFALRREQGRLKEIEPVVRYFVQQHTVAGTWRPGLALIYSELGRTQEARAEFESLAQDDFVGVPRDSMWMGTIAYLADVCSFLGDRARADVLYQILLPFAGRNVVIGSAVVCYGALTRYLGVLATVLERWDEAERHFEDALTMNDRMGARPWLAHTQERYATMLLARRRSGDRDKAAALFDLALATAGELGMHALEERIAVGVARIRPGFH